MKRKSLIAIFFLILCSASLFAQEEKKEESFKNLFSQSFTENAAIFLGLTPTIYVVSDNDFSAPSPIVFPFYIGLTWPKDYFVSLQPSIKIFSTYYYVNNGQVYVAEIENRTASSFSFLLNIPVVFKVNFWDKTNITASVGVAFLIRFAVLASGVEDNDYGDTGSAKSDLSLINSSFYSGGKFIYLSTSADWMFNLKNGMEIGPEVSFYIPVVTLLSEFSMEGTMISVGAKFVF